MIVGAGSAGATLAARLSADPTVSVLLLEAGPVYASADTPPAIAGPNFWAALAEPGRVWPGVTARRTQQQEQSAIACGRGAGGGSSVNAQGVIRGIPADYDAWAQTYGCEGWAWPDVAPVFDRLLDGVVPMARRARDEWGPVDSALADGAQAIGFPWCDDYHANGALGVSPAGLMRRGDRRISTNDSHLEPARSRENLTIRGDVVVSRIALDGTRAVGVATSAGDIDGREVIVSAGAIHSPALLLRSGVGPASGHPGVGTNLIEHPVAGPILVLKPEAYGSEDSPPLSCVLRYSSGLGDAGDADMQILPLNTLGIEPPLLGVGCLWAAAMRVFSRGAVTLRSLDPDDTPIVEYNMLSDKRDLVRMADGVRRALEICQTPAVAAVADAVVMDQVGTTPADIDEPGKLHDWLVANVSGYAHVAGTCRMGPAEDVASVVDATCRVHRMNGLRVVDASVMPDIPRANTNLTTIMIAEHVADAIVASSF